MGECGCAADTPLVQFPGPEGVTYSLEVYPGCHYCSTPAGVVVRRVDRSKANGVDVGEDHLEHVPEATFHGYGSPDFEWAMSEFAVPVVNAGDLFEALVTLMGVEEHAGYAEGMFDRAAVAYVLPGAVRESLRAWHESNAERERA